MAADAVQPRRLRQSNRQYDRMRQPLEKEHAGQYVAIAAGGETVLGDTPLEAIQKAKEAFGPGSFLFKVGEKNVYTLR